MSRKIKKLLSKELLYASTVSIVVFLAMCGYIFTLGHRMTEARNLYIEAYRLSEKGKNEEALVKVNHSLELWLTSDAQKLKDNLK